MVSRSHKRPRVLTVAIATCVLVAISFVAIRAGRFRVLAQIGSTNPTLESAAHRARNKPLRIRPLVRRVLPVSQEDADWIDHQIQPVEFEKLSPSYCLHVLRAHGLDGRFASELLPTSNAVLEPLLDSQVGKRVFGQTSLIPVSTGARYRTNTPHGSSRWRQHHRDQNLASFAELGLPLSTALSVEGKPVSLRDVFRDSVANFHLKQNELVWTGLAYALYLLPQAEWVNRYGERYTFDDLATELLGRPLIGASCGGTHLISTLTMIVRADQEAPILSESVRRRVREHLDRCAQLAVDTQQEDGSWPGDWFYDSQLSKDYQGQSPPATPAHRLIITGHMAEWMLYLPAEMQVPELTLERASLWLLGHLKQIGTEEMSKQLCPCTHGICALRQLSFVDGANLHAVQGGE